MASFQAQKSLIVGVVLLAVGGIAFTEPTLRKQNAESRNQSITPPSLIKYFTAGQNLGVSAALWIDLVSWYGGLVVSRHTLNLRARYESDRLLEQSKLLIELDPSFPDPYANAAMLLAWYAGRPADSFWFLRKAMTAFPRDWTYPFYYGFFRYRFLHDRQGASQFLAIAGKLPKCPPYIPLLATRLVHESQGLQDAIDLLKSFLATQLPPNSRKLIENELITLRSIQQTQLAVASYKAQFGKVPTVRDLLTAHLLSEEPHDALGVPLKIDAEGKVTASSGGLH